MGEKRKTPSEGFLNEGMEPFWLKERFPTVPEAMGEDKRISFHSSWEQCKGGCREERVGMEDLLRGRRTTAVPLES